MPPRLLVVIGALAVAYAVVVQPVGCNQTAHYALVQALGDGTARIDRYHQETCDKSYIGGRYYAAKAPGLALVTEPWYLVLHAAGAVPENPARAEPWPEGMLGVSRRALWQVRLWGALLPALALVLMAGLVAERFQPRSGAPVAATLGLGTLLLPFATDFFDHALSAALGFAAFALLLAEPPGGGRRPLHAAAAGLCAGLAVVAEFPLALVAAALGAYLLARAPRLRRLLAYAGGVVLGVLPLLAFNWWTFGSPFSVAYENAVLNPGTSGHDVVATNEGTLFGLGPPEPRAVLELLFAARGLLVLTPVVALGWLGAVLLHRRGARAEGWLLGLLPLAFIVYNSGYAVPFGGFTPGPRFLVPAIPFLAVALAPVFAAWPLTATALALASAGTMVVGTAAAPMLENDNTRHWLGRWLDADFTHTVVTLAGGGHGWAAIVPFLAAALVAAAAGLARRLPVGVLDLRTAAAAVLAWVVVMTAAPDLLRVDAVMGEAWGAAAIVALVAACALVAARAGSLAVLGAVPLSLLLATHFAVHTKQALLIAAVALATAFALSRVSERRAVSPA